MNFFVFFSDPDGNGFVLQKRPAPATGPASSWRREEGVQSSSNFRAVEEALFGGAEAPKF